MRRTTEQRKIGENIVFHNSMSHLFVFFSFFKLFDETGMTACTVYSLYICQCMLLYERFTMEQNRSSIMVTTTVIYHRCLLEILCVSCECQRVSQSPLDVWTTINLFPISIPHNLQSNSILHTLNQNAHLKSSLHERREKNYILLMKTNRCSTNLLLSQVPLFPRP